MLAVRSLTCSGIYYSTFKFRKVEEKTMDLIVFPSLIEIISSEIISLSVFPIASSASEGKYK